MTRLLVGLALLASALLIALAQPGPASAAPVLSSVTVTDSVVGGQTVEVRVTLSARATANTRVTLASSNRTTLPVPGAITVRSGRTTASVDVESGAVSRTTSVTVTARLGGTTKTDRVSVKPPVLASVSLPARVESGSTATGTVRLTGPAPAGGSVVTLKVDRTESMGIPASVRVGAGATTARFVVTAEGITQVDVLVTARLGVVKTDVVTVTVPIRLISIVASERHYLTYVNEPDISYPDEPDVATLNLASAAPRDLVIAVGSSDPTVATAPATVTIPAGERRVEIPVENLALGTTEITASFEGQSERRSWTVEEMRLVSVEVGPVYVGLVTTGRVELRRPAAADTLVYLQCYGPNGFTVPQTVTVPAGAASAEFPVTGRRAWSTEIRAVIDGEPDRFRPVTVVEIVDDLTVPARLSLGETGTGVLTLVAPAPTAFEVTLSSTPSVATVPATLTVPAGATVVDVPITTVAQGSSAIVVSFQGVTIRRDVVVTDPPTVQGLTLVDAYLGMPTTGHVVLNVDPLEETTVQLASSDPGVATVPAATTVAAGSTTGSFGVTPVGEGQTTITATLDGVSVTRELRVSSFVQTVDTQGFLYPLVAGQTIDVTFADAATGPLTLGLSTDSALLTVPASVEVAAGATSVQVPVTASGAGSVGVTVTLNGFSVTRPVGVAFLLRDAAATCACAVYEGQTTSAVVRLWAAPTSDVSVELNVVDPIDPAIAAVPAEVTVVAGTTEVAFSVTTTGPGTATIMAVLDGVSAAFQVEILVNPLSATAPSGAIVVGGTDDTARVLLAYARESGDVDVTVTIDDAAVATGPASVTIPAGSTEASIALTGVGAGTTSVTLGANGQEATFEVVVTEP